MAGLRLACSDKLGALEERIAAASEATSAIRTLDSRHHWASGVAHTLTPAFLMPRKCTR